MGVEGDKAVTGVRTFAQECLDHGRDGLIISTDWLFQEMDREIPALSPSP
jgi:hypothetical protein